MPSHPCLHLLLGSRTWLTRLWTDFVCTSCFMLLKCAQIVRRLHCSKLFLQWLIRGWWIPTSTCPASKHDVLRGIAAGVERAQFWTLNIFACKRHTCTRTHTHTYMPFSLQTCRSVTRMLMIPWRSSRRTVFARFCSRKCPDFCRSRRSHRRNWNTWWDRRASVVAIWNSFWKRMINVRWASQGGLGEGTLSALVPLKGFMSRFFDGKESPKFDSAITGNF